MDYAVTLDVGRIPFVKLQKNFFPKRRLGQQRAAFADELKKDLDELCRHKIGISAFTKDSKEKEIIRPLLVTYGTEVIRKMDENWWIEKLEKTLGVHQHMNLIPIVTDVRYENEMKWVQEKHNGVVIHINRVGIKPANSEERINNPILKRERTIEYLGQPSVMTVFMRLKDLSRKLSIKFIKKILKK